MRSLELTLEGNKVALAGDAEAAHLELRFTLCPSSGRIFYTLSALSNRDKYGKSEYMLWAEDQSTEFGSLELKMIDADTPDKAKRKRPTTHWWNKDGEAEEMCSFCGKLQSEAQLLVRGHGASICDECSKIAYDTMVENGAIPSK